MFKSTRRLTAIMTIDYGTPKAPLTAAPGEDFDCPADEAAGLIERGAAAEPKGKPVASEPAAPVEIPEGWADLLAPDLIALARKLGASKDVNTKGEAHDLVTRIVADRAAAQPPPV